jgi:predicted AAA+ superfamily ATPase
MLIKRYYDNLETHFDPKRVLVLYGPRRVGKTTLLNNMIDRMDVKYRLDTGDDITVQEALGSQKMSEIDNYVSDYQLIAIDEAQLIPNIGMGLKMMIDKYPERKIIATGSSSFDLARNVGEPLTGRKWTLTLYPVSQLELLPLSSPFDLKRQLEDFLVFGSYPEVLTADSREKKQEILAEIANSYLFKDILALDGRMGTRFVVDLTKLLALQVGNEVSLHELATTLQVDSKTVERYLDLLEQTFVIYRLGSFSRNLRSELRKKQKYYFVDNGIRNAIINQFNTLDSRTDVGALWENFVFIERMKYRSYKRVHSNTYFWRTHDKQEIDIVEESDGKLNGYEIKWSEKKGVKSPPDWLGTYPNAEFTVITPDNYLDFITDKAEKGSG